MTARPRSLITGERMEKINWGPNWEEILGGEFSKRSKDRVTDEGLIVSANNGGYDRIPYPSNAYVQNNVGGTGLNLLTVDPTADLWSGAVLLRKYNDDILSKTWGVQEKVTTGYLKSGIDTSASSRRSKCM